MAEPYALYLAMTRHPLIKHGLKLRRDTLSQVRWYHDKPEGLDDAFFEVPATCAARASLMLSSFGRQAAGALPWASIVPIP